MLQKLLFYKILYLVLYPHNALVFFFKYAHHPSLSNTDVY